MKKSLKTIVRAISPFVRKGEEKTGDDVAHYESDASQFHWDLSEVDIKHALKLFYKKFNPEKSFIVGDILQKYVGEEQFLLQQLCERYNQSEADMQEFLDRATITPAGRQQKEFVNQNVDSQGSRPSSRASERVVEEDYHTFWWNLDGVDPAALLELVYRKHNPTKVPNLDVVRTKTADELQVILRQFCKRHELTFSQMENYVKSCNGRQDKRRLSRGARSPSDLSDSNASSPTSGRNTARRVSVRDGSRPDNSSSAGEMSDPEEKVSTQPDEDSQPASDTSSARDKALSLAHMRPVLGDGKRLDMDSVVNQFQRRQKDHDQSTVSSKSVPPPPPSPPTVPAQAPSLPHRGETPPQPPPPSTNGRTSRGVASVELTAQTAHTSPVQTTQLTAELDHTRKQLDRLSKENQDILQALQESSTWHYQLQSQQRALQEQLQVQLQFQQEQQLAEQQRKVEAEKEKERQREREAAKAQKKPHARQQSVQTTETWTSVQNREHLQQALLGEQEKRVSAEETVAELKELLHKQHSEFESGQRGSDQMREKLKALQADREDLLQLLSALDSSRSAASVGKLISVYVARLAEKSPNIPNDVSDLMKDKTRLLGDRVDAMLRWKRTVGQATDADFWSVSNASVDADSDRESGTGGEMSARSQPSTVEAMLTQQYENTLQRQRDQMKLSQSAVEKTATALATQTLQTEKQMRRAVTPQGTRQTAAAYLPPAAVPQAPESDPYNVADSVQDWVECRDPRTQRTYFFSPSMRQSTWRRPLSLQRSRRSPSPAPQTSDNASPTHKTRPAVDSSDSVSVVSSNSVPSLFSQRAASAGATRSAHPSRQPSPSLRSAGQPNRGSDWVETMDPKSQRRYYYNRVTKVSTWRRPADLI